VGKWITLGLVWSMDKDGKCLILILKKLVSTSKSAYISVSNESILQINLILTSPNLVLTFYTYKVSSKKVSS
jgi:hypothetical protein